MSSKPEISFQSIHDELKNWKINDVNSYSFSMYKDYLMNFTPNLLNKEQINGLLLIVSDVCHLISEYPKDDFSDIMPDFKDILNKYKIRLYAYPEILCDVAPCLASKSNETLFTSYVTELLGSDLEQCYLSFKNCKRMIFKNVDWIDIFVQIISNKKNTLYQLHLSKRYSFIHFLNDMNILFEKNDYLDAYAPFDNIIMTFEGKKGTLKHYEDINSINNQQNKTIDSNENKSNQSDKAMDKITTISNELPSQSNDLTKSTISDSASTSINQSSEVILNDITVPTLTPVKPSSTIAPVNSNVSSTNSTISTSTISSSSSASLNTQNSQNKILSSSHESHSVSPITTTINKLKDFFSTTSSLPTPSTSSSLPTPSTTSSSIDSNISKTPDLVSKHDSPLLKQHNNDPKMSSTFPIVPNLNIEHQESTISQSNAQTQPILSNTQSSNEQNNIDSLSNSNINIFDPINTVNKLNSIANKDYNKNKLIQENQKQTKSNTSNGIKQNISKPITNDMKSNKPSICKRIRRFICKLICKLLVLLYIISSVFILYHCEPVITPEIIKFIDEYIAPEKYPTIPYLDMLRTNASIFITRNYYTSANQLNKLSNLLKNKPFNSNKLNSSTLSEYIYHSNYMINNYYQQTESVRTLYSNIERKLKKAQSAYDDASANLISQNHKVDDINKQLDEKVKRNSELEADNRILLQSRALLLSSISILTEINRNSTIKYNVLLDSINQQKNDYDIILKENERYKKLIEFYVSINSNTLNQDKFHSMETKYSELLHSYQDSRNDNTQLNENLKQCQHEKGYLNVTISKNSEELINTNIKLTKQIRKTEKITSEKQSLVEQMKELNNNYNFLTKENNYNKDSIKDLKDQISKLNNDNSACKNSNKQLKEQQQTATDKYNELKLANEGLVNYNTDIDKKYRELTNKHNLLDTEYNELIKKNDKLTKNYEYCQAQNENKKNSVSSMTSQCDAISKMNSELNIKYSAVEKQLDDSIKHNDDLQTMYNNLNTQYNSLFEDKALLNNRILLLQERLDEIQNTNDQLMHENKKLETNDVTANQYNTLLEHYNILMDLNNKTTESLLVKNMKLLACYDQNTKLNTANSECKKTKQDLTNDLVFAQSQTQEISRLEHIIEGHVHTINTYKQLNDTNIAILYTLQSLLNNDYNNFKVLNSVLNTTDFMILHDFSSSIIKQIDDFLNQSRVQDIFDVNITNYIQNIKHINTYYEINTHNIFTLLQDIQTSINTHMKFIHDCPLLSTDNENIFNEDYYNKIETYLNEQNQHDISIFSFESQLNTINEFLNQNKLSNSTSILPSLNHLNMKLCTKDHQINKSTSSSKSNKDIKTGLDHLTTLFKKTIGNNPFVHDSFNNDEDIDLSSVVKCKNNICE